MFLYFIPGLVSVNAAKLVDVGLSHIVDQPQDLVAREAIRGPNGGGGCVFTSSRSVAENRVGHYPDKQTWQKFDKFWIGKFNDEPTEIKRLERAELQRHHTWKDWQGNAWKIPIARKWQSFDGRLVPACVLPNYLQLNEQGEWVFGGILPHLARLWDFAVEFQDKRMKAADIAIEKNQSTYEFELPGLNEVIETVIAINYRVSKFEISLLKVLQVDSAGEIMRLVVDDPGLEELQKKTEADSGNT